MAVKWSGEQTCSLLLQISGKNNGQNFKRADSYTVRDPPFVQMGEFSCGENFVRGWAPLPWQHPRESCEGAGPVVPNDLSFVFLGSKLHMQCKNMREGKL